MLAKGLKYAPPPELNQEKTIIECESIIQKLGKENDKKRIRWEVGNLSLIHILQFRILPKD